MVKGSSLIKTLVSNGFLEQNYKTNIPISNLSGKNIVIDTSIFIHKYSNNLYVCFINLIKIFKSNNCNLIFCFDDEPPKEKKIVLDERKQKKKKSQILVKKYEEDLNTLEEKLLQPSITEKDEEEIKKKKSEITSNIKKYRKRTFSIKPEHIILLKSLFNLLKIPYIHYKKREADVICSTLVKMNIADACLSDDYDLMSYNCKYILRNLDLTKGTVDIINLDDIYNKISLNYEKFIYLVIMNGTDYSKKIKDVNKDVKDVNKYVNIPYIYSLLLNGYNITDILSKINNTGYDYETALNIFTQKIDINPIRDIVNYDDLNLIYKLDNIEKLNFLSKLETYISKTNNVIDIKKIDKKINEYISLFSYVNPYVYL